MKPVISRLAGRSTLFFFPLLLVLRSKWRNYILLLMGTIVLVGCFRSFYKPATTNQVDAARIAQLKNSNKYFIIHYRDSILALSNIAVSDQVLTGKTEMLAAQHTLELNPDDPERDKSLRSKTRSAVLSEVHLYVNTEKKASTGSYPYVSFPVSDIYRMDVYEFDEQRTRKSTTWSIVGIGATVAIIVIAVAAGTSDIGVGSGSSSGGGCGCPQVYIEQKGNFEFQNGIFSGAVYANLERQDHLPLGSLPPGDPELRFRIAGHDNEVQYLNFVQLAAVPHEPGTKVLADRHGKYFSIRQPVPASTATAQGKEDLGTVLNDADGKTFAFNSMDESENYSRVYLGFKNQGESNKAKFIIRAKNSNWSARLYEEYNLLFGEDYLRYRDRQEKTGPGKMEANLLRQGLPIKVYVQKGDSWEYAGYFPLAGTEGFRDMVMELNLPDDHRGDVRLKLESVYRFWDLDYAAMDFSAGEPLQPILLDPATVRHNTGGDHAKQLAAKDRAYSQLANNERIDLAFRLPAPTTEKTMSYFLVSGGYYHISHAYPVAANARRLRAFTREAEFDRFSKEKYHEMEQWQTLVKNNSK